MRLLIPFDITRYMWQDNQKYFVITCIVKDKEIIAGQRFQCLCIYCDEIEFMTFMCSNLDLTPNDQLTTIPNVA